MSRAVFFIALLCFYPLSHAAPQKIIIDADVGIDDTMAIMLAMASPELDLVGITTIFGNATIENSTRNARYLVKRSGLKIPVVKGADRPLSIPPEPPADFVHGKNGLGDVDIEFGKLPTGPNISAAQFIVEQSRRYPGKLTLVPVGRLTNLALALKLDPTLPERIRRVVLMGGAFTVPGNVTPVAEANIIGDPHAADIVFAADWDVIAIGLDVTTKIAVNNDHLSVLAEKNPVAGGFVRDVSQFYLAFYRSVGIKEGFYIHDPAAIIYLLQPDLFDMRQASVRVATEGIAIGQTIAAFPPHDEREGKWFGVKKSTLALSVDANKARDLFIQRLTTLKFRSK